MNNPLKKKLRIGLPIGAVIFVVLFVAFIGSRAKQTPPQSGPLEVEVVRVEQRDVPVYGEWIGTLDGSVNAEIRAQVSGYLLRQNYKEGSYIRKGNLLFEIDPRPFQAALDQAKGDLAKGQAQIEQSNSQLRQAEAQLAAAEANQVKAQLDVDRYAPLAKEKAITDQEMDNAVQANQAAKAQVNAAKAGVETAKSVIVAARAGVIAAEASVETADLNLGFTKIYSPVDGIAGIAQAQIGNLIQPNNPTSGPLTTVSTVDPIKVYFTVSEQEYLNYARNHSIQDTEATPDLELVLADGTTYGPKGRFFVSDRQVDQKTGSLRLAGLFPNPGNVLRPGQYGRVRALANMNKDALVVPQRSVTELQGSYQVAVVGPDNKVDVRAVKLGSLVDSLWVVEDGLKPGENVIVEGTQKVRPGALVTPKSVSSPAVKTQ